MKVKLLEPIDGFEDVAEWRVPEDGEWAVKDSGEPCRFYQSLARRIVLTPVKRWRPATIDDAVRAIKGETVKARFRDSKSDNWQESRLHGYQGRGEWLWVSSGNVFRHCEVLDA